MHSQRAHDLAVALTCFGDNIIVVEGQPYVETVLRIAFELSDFVKSVDQSAASIDWIRGTLFSGVDSIAMLVALGGQIFPPIPHFSMLTKKFGLDGSVDEMELDLDSLSRQLRLNIALIDNARIPLADRCLALRRLCLLELIFLGSIL